MKTITQKAPEPVKLTTIDVVLDLLAKHNETTKAIVEDYIGGPGMETELAAAYDNLRFSIKEMEEEPLTFDKLYAQLKIADDVDYDKLIALCKDEEFDVDAMLDLVDEDDIADKAKEYGYALIQVTNMALRDKLETFINNEIYPFHLDQEKFVKI